MNKDVLNLIDRPNESDGVSNLGGEAFVGFVVKFLSPSCVQIAFSDDFVDP